VEGDITEGEVEVKQFEKSIRRLQQNESGMEYDFFTE